MKKIIRTVISASILLALFVNCFVGEGPTSTVKSSFIEPFPKQFDGMLSSNCLPEIVPVAIYLYKDNKVFYTCVGLAFKSDANNGHTLIAPEHLFAKGENYSYAIRIARPGNTNIDGYIDSIISTSKDNAGLDIVFASIGNKPKVIKGYFCGAYTNKLLSSSSATVVIGKKEVTHIYSYITGKQALIIGHVSECNNPDKVKGVLIEAKNGGGYSGSPFYDEYGRFYFLQAGLVDDDPALPIINRQYQEQLHRNVEGVACLIGPVEISKETY